MLWRAMYTELSAAFFICLLVAGLEREFQQITRAFDKSRKICVPMAL
jgi:hypothetical protein